MFGCAIDGCGGREDEVVDVMLACERQHLGGGMEVDFKILVGFLH